MFKPVRSLAELNLGRQITWYLLAFQAGYINAGGFLACHRFVTHTTGFATFFGVEFAQGNYQTALNMLAVPIFFLLGTIASAFFIDRQKAHHKRPQFTIVLLIMSLLLLSVSLLGAQGSFGVFGEAFENSRDFSLLAILCLASGLQNALTTTATGAIVRTTHLTGMTTDLGLGIARVIWGNKAEREQIHQESAANKIRMGILGGFVAGSVSGAIIFLKIQYFGFFAPAALSSVLTMTAFFNSQNKGAHP